MNASLFERKTELEKSKKEIVGKIEALEEKYIEQDIDRELYPKYRLKYESQIAEIDKELQIQVEPLSNPEKFIDFSISM